MFVVFTVRSFNNHFYTILPGITSTSNAVSRASSLTYRGMKGYLATLDTFEEWAFIFYQLRARRAWISANDTNSEGVWMTAPTSSSNGGPALIIPWGPYEPGGGTNENCAVIAVSFIADYPCSSADVGYYVAEFECLSPNVLFNGSCLRMICLHDSTSSPNPCIVVFYIAPYEYCIAQEG